MNQSLNMIAETHEENGGEAEGDSYFLTGNAFIDQNRRALLQTNVRQPQTVKGNLFQPMNKEMDMSVINKDSTNVETYYQDVNDISGVDLLHKLQEAERGTKAKDGAAISDPVDSSD
jgi:hypothetical protein